MADRILVYAVTGSGKTTLASAISERTGLPWHCVDDLTWEPGWKAVPLSEQRHRIAGICTGEKWVLDTAYSAWVDVPLARADVVLALDYPRVVSLSRLLRRTVLRALDQRPVCNGNTESFRQAFSRDSIIVWHFRSFSRKRARIRRWVDDPPGPTVVRLTSPRATRRWLRSLGRWGAAAPALCSPTPSWTVGSGRGGVGPPAGQRPLGEPVDLYLTHRAEGAHVVLEVAGEIDVDSAPVLQERLETLVDEGHHHLVLDMEDVDFLDSAALGVLVNGLKRVRAHDGSLRLVIPQVKILKVFQITGLTKVFAIHPSVGDALTAAGSAAS